MPLLADPLLTIRAAQSDDVYLLALYGELDLSQGHRLEAALRRAEASGARSIVVDLSALHFMDSTGLRILLGAQRRCEASGRPFELLRGPRTVHRVFEVAGFAEHFRFVD